MAGHRSVCLVVPCFDEVARLSLAQLDELSQIDGVSLVLVDDGSTDGTCELLDTFVAAHERASVVTVATNVGKGEAVRRGLLEALDALPAWVGYVDADLSTQPSETARLVDIAMANDELDVVMGSRVAMLGRRIVRSPLRHYTGRVFATGASIVLGKPVYDTQCGAKLFRSGPRLRHALAAPFRSRWAFDVELLGRLDRVGVPAEAFREEPLEAWVDRAGSKRSLRASVRAMCDLVMIRRDLARWERR